MTMRTGLIPVPLPVRTRAVDPRPVAGKSSSGRQGGTIIGVVAAAEPTDRRGTNPSPVLHTRKTWSRRMEPGLGTAPGDGTSDGARPVAQLWHHRQRRAPRSIPDAATRGD